MPLQHLQLFPVFQADDVIGEDALPDRHGRFRGRGLGFRGAGRELGEAAIDGLDQGRDLEHRDVMVPDMCNANYRCR